MSLVSSSYSFSNSLTSSSAFLRFSLPSYVSSFTVYPFQCTKNISFPLTTLLFSIFSTSNSSSSLITIGFGGVFFCPSTWGLYRYTQLTFTTGCILTELSNSNSIALYSNLAWDDLATLQVQVDKESSHLFKYTTYTYSTWSVCLSPIITWPSRTFCHVICHTHHYVTLCHNLLR